MQARLKLVAHEDSHPGPRRLVERKVDPARRGVLQSGLLNRAHDADDVEVSRRDALLSKVEAQTDGLETEVANLLGDRLVHEGGARGRIAIALVEASTGLQGNLERLQEAVAGDLVVHRVPIAIWMKILQLGTLEVQSLHLSPRAERSDRRDAGGPDSGLGSHPLQQLVVEGALLVCRGRWRAQGDRLDGVCREAHVDSLDPLVARQEERSAGDQHDG